MSFFRTKSIHILISFLILSSLLISCTNPEEEEDNSDRTPPTSSFSLSPSGRCTVDASDDTHYNCTGPVKVTVSSNESGSIYYGLVVGGPGAISTSATTPVGIAINADDTYLQYYPRDGAGNNGSTKNLRFTIQGVTPNINAGYYNEHQILTLSLNTNRYVNTSPLSGLSDYEIWLKQSSDVTAVLPSVFNLTATTGDADTSLYYDKFGTPVSDPYPNGYFKALSATNQTTTVYEFRYNILYDNDNDGTTDSSDADGYGAYYIDKDLPNIMALPPASGTLDASMDVKAYLQDDGYDRLSLYSQTNTFLNTAATIKAPEADYCTPSISPDQISLDFWNSCLESTNRTNLILDSNNRSITNAITVSSDKYIPFAAIDPAGNRGRCYSNILSCVAEPIENNDTDYAHVLEQYTPGRLQTQRFHDAELNNGSPLGGTIRNFGHSVAVGSLDGGSYPNDIVIGAPAYSTQNADTSNEAKGAIYIWYNEFRERAKRTFSLGATTNVTGSTVSYSVDGNANLIVYLDPADAAYTGATGEVRAIASEYSDGTGVAATTSEITSVLNRAFLSSLGTTYSSPLYAIADDNSTDVTVGHRNKTIQGYFTSTSAMALNYAGTIRAYDAMYYGENDNDQFGFSIAIGSVDQTDSSGNKVQIIVGAPGFNSDQGKAYVILNPATGYQQLPVSGNADEIIGDGGSAGKFGFAIFTKNIDGTSNGDASDELFISAPELTVGANTRAGRVYALDDNHNFDLIAENITVAADVLTDEPTPRTDSLFGFSLMVGKTASYPDKHNLFVGAPGKEYSGTLEGYVYRHTINSDLTSGTVEDFHDTTAGFPGNLFGYSIGIVEGDASSDTFDTSTGPSKCVVGCLAIGSPYSGNNGNGRVYLRGQGLWTWLEGGSAEHLGVKVHGGKFGPTSTLSLFVGSRGQYSEGKLSIVLPQALTSSVPFTASKTILGEYKGGRLANSLASFWYIGGDSVSRYGVIAGGAGQGEEDISNNLNNRIGEVNIFSYGRFFNNQE